MKSRFFGHHQEDTGRDPQLQVAIHTVYVSLAELFYPIYAHVIPTNETLLQRFEHKLKEANFSTTSDLYLSAAFGIGTIAGIILGIIAFTVAYSILVLGNLTLPSIQYNWLPFVPPWILNLLSVFKVPTAILLTGILGAGVGLLFGGIAAILIPYMRAAERDRQIRMVFPDAIGMMYALAIGGMDQLDTFRQVAESEDVYGELAVEFQRIIRQTDVFQRDYESAVGDVAKSTPNQELSRFLTDMLSVMNSGGDFLFFLTEMKDDQQRDRRRNQESRLRWLETLGQVYINLQIAPMLIVIVLVIMAMVGDPKITLMLTVVYIIEPGLNLFYLILIGMVKIDDPGTGYMELNGTIPQNIEPAESLSLGPIETYRQQGSIFPQIHRHEAIHRARTILQNPLTFFKANPSYTFVLTIPLSLSTIVLFILLDEITLSASAFVETPIKQTIGLLFLPFYINLLPYVIMFEWSRRTRGTITDSLPTDLRKLANTNQTGQPLHESMRITAQDNNTRFGTELGIIYNKLKLGIPFDRAFVEFNNKYHIPRLARMVKIIEKAQEVSSEITEVLQTAAEVADTQLELEKERYVRTTMQVVVVEMTFFVFLAILAGMELYLIEKVIAIIGPDPAWPSFDSVDPRLLKAIFFHAALIQGVTSGLVAGYVQSGNIRSGAKFALLNGTLALFVWVYIAIL